MGKQDKAKYRFKVKILEPPIHCCFQSVQELPLEQQWVRCAQTNKQEIIVVLKEIKYFHKLKSARIRSLFIALKGLRLDEDQHQVPEWIDFYSKTLCISPKLLKLLASQIKSPHNKYSFFLPPFLFKQCSNDTYVSWLEIFIDFKIEDSTKYLKRIEWTQSGFIFYLSKKSSVKRYTKKEIKKYANAMLQGQSAA